jgi:hypothetical protein
MEVIVRAAENRASVAKENRDALHDIATDLKREGKFFSDWVDASQRASQVQDITKRMKGAGLEDALERFRREVEVRILSEADFNYKYFDRVRFRAAVEDLTSATKGGDKAAVVQAAKELTGVLKEAEIMELAPESQQLKLEVTRLLKGKSSICP